MKFWLTELSLFVVIQNGLKENGESSTTKPNRTPTSEKTDGKKDDLVDKDILYHGRILSALSDDMYSFSH